MKNYIIISVNLSHFWDHVLLVYMVMHYKLV